MLKKWVNYFFLSFLSFCFFIVLFQTVAYAQNLLPSPSDTYQTKNASPNPTPTLYKQPPSPTPTIFTFPTDYPTVTPVPLMSTPFPKPTIAVVTDLETLFSKYSTQYQVDREELKKIARCESNFNTDANNAGLYLGMFQFAASSWVNVRNSMGLDTNPDLRMNAEEAIRTAAYMIANGRINAWAGCK